MTTPSAAPSPGAPDHRRSAAPPDGARPTNRADRATGRVAALVVLLLLAAAALRGYLPAGRPPDREETGGNSALALLLLVILLCVTLGILAIAIIMRMRDRRAVPSSFGALPALPKDRGGRAGWRVLLITLGVIAGWVLAVLLLRHLFAGHPLGWAPPGEFGGRSAGPAGPDIPVPPGAARPPGRPAPHSDVIFRYVAAIGALTLIVIAAAVVAGQASRRPGASPVAERRGRHPATDARPGPAPLARAAERGLAEIADPACDPRAAIIGCYAAMERELAHLPGAVPQDCDTPTEVLARAVDHRVLPPENARQLVNLFAEARFSSHRMTELHRADAIRVLRLVLDELQGTP